MSDFHIGMFMGAFCTLLGYLSSYFAMRLTKKLLIEIFVMRKVIEIMLIKKGIDDAS